MPLTSIEDLSTHIHTEALNNIIRRDNSIAARAIAAAESEAKMYLGRYDLFALFGDEHTPPHVQDEFLKHLLKDIACWYIIRLANPVMDYAAYRKTYDEAIRTLEKIMQGLAAPDAWPFKEEVSTVPPGNNISWSSNPKRDNYY